MRSTLMEKLSSPAGGGQAVLVVVDDPDLAELLVTTLELAGYRVGAAISGAAGVERLARRRFDPVVCDAMLTDLECFARGRRAAPQDRPPLLHLTTCEALIDLVPYLEPGAEDYVVKPLRIAEVLDRARALLRTRSPERLDGMPCYGDLVLDGAAYQARRGSRPLCLTPAEYRLVSQLLENSERVLSKEQISRLVWGDFRGHGAIEKLVARLRRKVDQEEPALIHTRRGFGYWLGRPEG